MSTVRAAGVPSAVSTYLLCGGTPNIPGVYNENTGPSDGLLFIASCQDTGGIATVGGNTLISSNNHLTLGWSSTAKSTVSGWLG